MSRRFTLVSVVLTAVVAFLVGAILTGGLPRASVAAGRGAKSVDVHAAARPSGGVAPAALVNFADVVERINPAVVNIDATTQGSETRRRRSRAGVPDPPELFDGPFGFGTPRDDRDAPRRGAGRSEERRVGKECRSARWPVQEKRTNGKGRI